MDCHCHCHGRCVGYPPAADSANLAPYLVILLGSMTMLRSESLERLAW